MGIRIENNLFYVESKGLSLIIENRDGYLLLKHLGKTIKNYKVPIVFMNGTMPFQEIQQLLIEPLVWIRNVRFLDNMVWVTLENQLYRFNMMQLK